MLQVAARESELRDYQSKLDHDRKKVESANASRKTDQAKMDYAVAEVRLEMDQMEQKYEEQLRGLRRQLQEVHADAQVDFEIKRSEIVAEVGKEWETKMAKAVASMAKKEGAKYDMLKEDYDELVRHPARLFSVPRTLPSLTCTLALDNVDGDRRRRRQSCRSRCGNGSARWSRTRSWTMPKGRRRRTT